MRDRERRPSRTEKEKERKERRGEKRRQTATEQYLSVTRITSVRRSLVPPATLVFNGDHESSELSPHSGVQVLGPPRRC